MRDKCLSPVGSGLRRTAEDPGEPLTSGRPPMTRTEQMQVYHPSEDAGAGALESN